MTDEQRQAVANERLRRRIEKLNEAARRASKPPENRAAFAPVASPKPAAASPVASLASETPTSPRPPVSLASPEFQKLAESVAKFTPTPATTPRLPATVTPLPEPSRNVSPIAFTPTPATTPRTPPAFTTPNVAANPYQRIAEAQASRPAIPANYARLSPTSAPSQAAGIQPGPIPSVAVTSRATMANAASARDDSKLALLMEKMVSLLQEIRDQSDGNEETAKNLETPKFDRTMAYTQRSDSPFMIIGSPSGPSRPQG